MTHRSPNGITLDDIARELGVASSTVSRALRGDPRISREMIAKVEETATRMGYVPNIAARSLRTGQSSMIGLIVRDIQDGFSTETMRSVEQSCAEQGYGLLLCNSNDEPEKEQYYLTMLQQHRADGILILTPTSAKADPYLLASQMIPIVLMDTQLEDRDLCTVTVDHVQGGFLATEHLLQLGHRHIAFLSGPLHLSPCARMVEGYRQALLKVGIPEQEHKILIADQTGLEDARAGAQAIFERYPEVTALATISDLMAAGALNAARQQKLQVPEDFSIVGYDDVPLASLTSPALTTVAQDKWALGNVAVELLLEEISSEKHQHSQVVLAPSLVVRGSTAYHAEDHNR